MKIYLYTLLLFPTFIYSQVDSLKDLLNYYPLQIGNYWEYKITNEQMPYPPDTVAYSIKVKGDTTLDNKIVYKILAYQDIYPNHNKYYQYIRIDSLTGSVFRYYKDSSLANDEYKTDSLYAQPGDTINCSESFQSSGNYKTICRSKGIDTLFGKLVQVKIFYDYSNIPGGEYGIAKGFGNYFGASCELSCSYGSLVYAKINGIEYGNKIVTRVKENTIIPSKFILFQNYPNPFNPSTNIIFEIPEPGNVTLRIYDVLGKVMESHKLNYLNSGEHTFAFNGSKYSSGIYFYQIEYKQQVKTRKMLILK